MPSMANISLVNAAGTTVSALVATPSAGDSVPARWRLNNNNPPAFKPVFSVVAKKSGGKGNVRRVSLNIDVPNAVTINGIMSANGTIRFIGEFVVSQEIPTSVVDDAVAYVTSFLSSALIVDTLKTQIAPT